MFSFDRTGPSYLTPNFILCSSVTVCRGEFPASLLDEWDTWDAENQSENVRPDLFGDDQLFIVFQVIQLTPVLNHSV